MLKDYKGVIIFAFEMGGNTGHLARSVPIIQSLKKDGYKVVPVVSDAKMASSIFGDVGIKYIYLSSPARRHVVERLILNYADSLLDVGYHTDEALAVTVQEWVGLINVLESDVVITDYAPSALLACRVTRVPSISIGSGFDQPDDYSPLPAFPLALGINKTPSFIETMRLKCDEVELEVKERINRFLTKNATDPLDNVAQVFLADKKIIASFDEIDHWQNRSYAVTHVGHIGWSENQSTVNWLPKEVSPRIFCYLSLNEPMTFVVIEALKKMNADAICCIRGYEHQGNDLGRLRIVSEMINISSLIPDADLVISYGGSGMIASSLLNSVPMLCIPMWVEQCISSIRVANINCGKTIIGQVNPNQVEEIIRSILSNQSIKNSVESFAKKYKGYNQDSAVKIVTDQVKSMIKRPSYP